MIELLAAAAADGGHAEASPVGLLIGLVLLALNFFFVAAEIALLAARRARIEERAEAGEKRAQQALLALQELSITFSGAQLGITMTSLGLGAIAEPALATVIDGWLPEGSLSGSARGAISFAIALSIVVFLHMVVGEMVPKNIALAKAEEVSMATARPFRLFAKLFRPLIVVMNGAGNIVVRAMGVEPVDEHGLVHTPEELALAVRESRRQGMLRPSDERVLSSVLHLSNIDAEAAMTPRVDLVGIAASAPASDVEALALETGFTRFPVYTTGIDEIVGLVHVKDVLIRDAEELDGKTVADLLRPLPAVPESRNLEHLLKDMRLARAHAALVVDEFGGTAGMLSLEDVIEELVGEIVDEFDADGTTAKRRNERSWTVPGTLRRDELQRLTGLLLPDTDAETIGGWLTEELGRLLKAGDAVEHDGWKLVVRSIEGRRAGEVIVTMPPEPEPADEQEQPA